MTQPDSPVPSGLSRLRRDTRQPKSRNWKPLAFTGLMLAMFALLTLRLFGDRLRPAVGVETARVLLLPAGESEPAASGPADILFQSSGWIEADPWPIRVAALADGVVAAVHFKEGDRVEEGQLLVDMVDEDVELTVTLLEREVELARLEAAAGAVAVEAAEQALAAAKARETRAAAALREAEDDWDRVRGLVGKDVLSAAEEVSAEQRFRQREADRLEAASGVEQAALEVTRRRRMLEAASQRVATVEARLDTALLERRRMRIHSPLDGRVQRRLVEPGSKRMRGMDDPDSATVAVLYDPEHLQVRVDVPLAEAGNLFVEQPATVTTALLPGREFAGVVTHIVGEADLQRNTLQAKVAIRNPDPRMRPETLCRVAFHGKPATGNVSVPSGGDALWIPADLIESTANETEVWVVDPLDNTVQSRTIRLGAETRDGLRRVLEGLNANQRVVLTSERPLTPGDRVSAPEL